MAAGLTLVAVLAAGCGSGRLGGVSAAGASASPPAASASPAASQSQSQSARDDAARRRDLAVKAKAQAARLDVLVSFSVTYPGEAPFSYEVSGDGNRFRSLPRREGVMSLDNRQVIGPDKVTGLTGIPALKVYFKEVTPRQAWLDGPQEDPSGATGSAHGRDDLDDVRELTAIVADPAQAAAITWTGPVEDGGAMSEQLVVDSAKVSVALPALSAIATVADGHAVATAAMSPANALPAVIGLRLDAATGFPTLLTIARDEPTDGQEPVLRTSFEWRDASAQALAGFERFPADWREVSQDQATELWSGSDLGKTGIAPWLES